MKNSFSPKLEIQNSSSNPLFLISLIQQFCQIYLRLLIEWLSPLSALLIPAFIILFFFLDCLHQPLHSCSSSAFSLHPIVPTPEPTGAEIQRRTHSVFGLKLSRPSTYLRPKEISAMPRPETFPRNLMWFIRNHIQSQEALGFKFPGQIPFNAL